jgi:hypothetical protein
LCFIQHNLQGILKNASPLDLRRDMPIQSAAQTLQVSCKPAGYWLYSVKGKKNDDLLKVGGEGNGTTNTTRRTLVDG